MVAIHLQVGQKKKKDPIIKIKKTQAKQANSIAPVTTNIFLLIDLLVYGEDPLDSMNISPFYRL